MSPISKKVSLSVLTLQLLSLSPALEASSENQKPFRVGVGIAAEYLTSTWDHKMSAHDVVRHATGNTSAHKKSMAISPSFEIGGYVAPNFYLGFFTSWRHANATTKANHVISGYYNLHYKLSVSHSFNALLKAGYKTSQEALIYIKAGPTLTKWTHKTTLIRKANVTHENIEISSFQRKRTSLGVSLGGGIEFPLFKNTTLSADYVHTFYKAVNTSSSIALIDPIIGPINGPVHEKIKLSHGALAVRLTYFF